MSNCNICGALEYWHADGEGAIAKPYCHRCNPQETAVLPLDVGKDYDIDESEIHGMPAPDFQIYGSDGKATTLTVDGSKIITAYDELPDTGEQGQMAVKKGENITYVFDGEEWQNLGEALLGKKRSVLSPRDKKIDRRAAIAATKAKNA